MLVSSSATSSSAELSSTPISSSRPKELGVLIALAIASSLESTLSSLADSSSTS